MSMLLAYTILINPNSYIPQLKLCSYIKSEFNKEIASYKKIYIATKNVECQSEF